MAARSSGHQHDSHRVAHANLIDVGGLAAADGYAIVPAEVDEVRAGDPVTVMLVT